jgi:hypothetical protein
MFGLRSIVTIFIDFCLMPHRKSFTNCARTYEISLSGPDCLPEDWPFKAALKGDHVRDAFTILSLLEDHQERNTTLIVPHTGDQANRFTEAIKARNMRFKLYGQKEVVHRCKKCTRIYEDENGKGMYNIHVLIPTRFLTYFYSYQVRLGCCHGWSDTGTPMLLRS